MDNFFSKFDGVTLSFNDMAEGEDGREFVEVLIDRINGKNFDFIFTKIPGFRVLDTRGFSDDEIKRWLEYTMRNSVLVWEIAKERRDEKLA